MTVCSQCGQIDMSSIADICFDCKEENRLAEIEMADDEFDIDDFVDDEEVPCPECDDDAICTTCEGTGFV